MQTGPPVVFHRISEEAAQSPRSVAWTIIPAQARGRTTVGAG